MLASSLIFRLAQIYASLPALLHMPGEWIIEDLRRRPKPLFAPAEPNQLRDSASKLQRLIRLCRDRALPTTSVEHGRGVDKIVVFAGHSMECVVIDLVSFVLQIKKSMLVCQQHHSWVSHRKDTPLQSQMRSSMLYDSFKLASL